jgi:dihydrolipoamide dehydrogenase
MSANGKTVLSLQERSFIKVIADKETGKVLGAQMMCARATDMISQFAQAIVNGLTLDDMSRVIYPHPTFSEGIGEAVK